MYVRNDPNRYIFCPSIRLIWIITEITINVTHSNQHRYIYIYIYDIGNLQQIFELDDYLRKPISCARTQNAHCGEQGPGPSVI